MSHNNNVALHLDFVLQIEAEDGIHMKDHVIQVFGETMSGLHVESIVGLDGLSYYGCYLPDTPNLLLARWYASVCNDGVWAQQLLGGGSLYLPTGHECGSILVMVDIGCTRAAKLHINGYHGQSTHINTPLDMQLAQRISQDVHSAHMKYGGTPQTAMTHVSTHLDTIQQMPLLWFSLAATEMARSSADINAINLFTHWLTIAERFAHHTQQDDASILADMIALSSLTWCYRADADCHGHVMDWWTPLWTFPNVDQASFDCEDGSRACLELFLLLCALPLDDINNINEMNNDKKVNNDSKSNDTSNNNTTTVINKRLKRIQELARSYTPFLTLCELKSKGARVEGLTPNYTLHLTLLLLDTRAQSIVLQPILIESTSNASGVWPITPNTTDAVWQQLNSVEDTLDPHDDYVSRFRAPIAMVVKQRMYARIYSLFTSSYIHDGTQQSIHYVLSRGIGTTFGIDANEFLSNPSTTLASMHVAVNYSTADLLRNFRSHLACAPASICPRAIICKSSSSSIKSNNDNSSSKTSIELPIKKLQCVDVLFGRPPQHIKVPYTTIPISTTMSLYHASMPYETS